MAAVVGVAAAAVEGAAVAAAATAAVLDILVPRTVRLQAEVRPGSHVHHLLRDRPVQEIELHRGRRIEHQTGPPIEHRIKHPIGLQTERPIEHDPIPVVIVT